MEIVVIVLASIGALFLVCGDILERGGEPGGLTQAVGAALIFMALCLLAFYWALDLWG